MISYYGSTSGLLLAAAIGVPLGIVLLIALRVSESRRPDAELPASMREEAGTGNE